MSLIRPVTKRFVCIDGHEISEAAILGEIDKVREQPYTDFYTNDVMEEPIYRFFAETCEKGIDVDYHVGVCHQRIYWKKNHKANMTRLKKMVVEMLDGVRKPEEVRL